MRYESEASSGSSCVGGIFNSDDGTCVPLPPYALRSGPRDTIYWEPKDVRADVRVALCGIVWMMVDSTAPLSKDGTTSLGLPHLEKYVGSASHIAHPPTTVRQVS